MTFHAAAAAAAAFWSYLVGARLQLLAVRVALARVLAGGPGQQPLPLPEVAGGNVPGSLFFKKREVGTEKPFIS